MKRKAGAHGGRGGGSAGNRGSSNSNSRGGGGSSIGSSSSSFAVIDDSVLRRMVMTTSTSASATSNTSASTTTSTKKRQQAGPGSTNSDSHNHSSTGNSNGNSNGNINSNKKMRLDAASHRPLSAGTGSSISTSTNTNTNTATSSGSGTARSEGRYLLRVPSDRHVDESIYQLLLHLRRIRHVLVLVRPEELRQVHSTMKQLLLLGQEEGEEGGDVVTVSGKMTVKQVRNNLRGSNGGGGSSNNSRSSGSDGACVRVVVDAGGLALLLQEGSWGTSSSSSTSKSDNNSSGGSGGSSNTSSDNAVFVIHAEGMAASFNGRALTSFPSTTTRHVLVLPSNSGSNSSTDSGSSASASAMYLASLPRLPVPPSPAAIAGLIARVKLARKIATLQGTSTSTSSSTSASTSSEVDGTSPSSSSSGVVASQLLALKNQLRALAVQPLGPVKVWDWAKGCLVDATPANTTTSSNSASASSSASNTAQLNAETTPHNLTSTASSDSAATVRQKMLILGMIADTSMPQYQEAMQREGAEQGRVLAASRWMDKMDGCRASAPWPGVIRFGTSADDASRSVCALINEQKALKIHCLSKCQPALDKHAAASVFDTTSTASRVVSGKVLRSLSDLTSCRVIGFQWRPNPLGDEDWGGRYGKACGHNEVAMQFSRPFAPIEVVNTHLCSRASPAPGNAGFDGCMEFLTEQCRWYQRAMHVWDDKHFYFISSSGEVIGVRKDSLLHLPVKKLTYVLDALRYLILHEGAALTTRQNLAMLGAYIHIYTSSKGFHLPSLPKSVHRRIGEFLLPKPPPSAW